MDIKKTLENFGKVQNHVFEELRELKNHFSNEDTLWAKIEKQNSIFFDNPNVICFLADTLQMVSNEDRLSKFTLKDIEMAYELLVKYYPQNMQYHIDLIEFVDSVMDDKEKASELLDTAIIKNKMYGKQLIKIKRKLK